MQTPFDWLTLMVFTGLVVLMLHRSAAEKPVDKLWHYAPPAVGCAIVNYIGNEGYIALAIAGLLAVIAYIMLVLRPKMSM